MSCFATNAPSGHFATPSYLPLLISKTFSKEEFSCRIDNTIEALENIQILLNHVNRDFLTGLYNRRYFYDYMFEYEKDALESDEQFSIAMVSIDDFENIKWDEFKIGTLFEKIKTIKYKTYTGIIL